MFSNLGSALAPARKRRGESAETRLRQENEQLRSKLGHQDEVIAEVAAEMVSLKNELGEL